MDIITKKFNELTVDELYGILHLRSKVFVVEQNCVYQDIDYRDSDSLHLFIKEGNQVVAYIRLLPPGEVYNETSLGRVVTDPLYRGQRLTQHLIKMGLTQAARMWPDYGIRISAQAYLQAYYEEFGFRVVSPVYLEDGIEHIEMLREY